MVADINENNKYRVAEPLYMQGPNPTEPELLILQLVTLDNV